MPQKVETQPGRKFCLADITVSLRNKVLLATMVAITIPMVSYLVIDSTLNRSMLLQDQAESLRLVADSMNARFMSCFNECEEAVNLFVETMGQVHPEIEAIIVDRGLNVIAATDKTLIGKKWEEPQFADVLSGKTEYEWDTMQHQGIPVMDVTVPMKDRLGLIAGVIHLAKPAVLVSKRIRDVRTRHGLFVLFVIAMVVSILGLILYRSVIRRLVRIDREIRQISSPAAMPPAHDAPGDEIDRLHRFLDSLVRELSGTAISLQQALDEKDDLLVKVNDLNTNLETEIEKTRNELQKVQEDLIRAEHLSTIGKLAAGLAHEIRNPLFIIRASAESLKSAAGRTETLPETDASLVTDIIEEVDRVNQMITKLLELARPVKFEKVQVPLNDLAREMADLFSKGLPENINVVSTCDDNESPIVCGDPALLRQALSNIVENAVHAVSEKGGILITTGTSAVDKIPYLKIRDNGCGIDDRDLPQIFDPFFSHRKGGTGLGLPSVKKILDLHQAKISVDSSPGNGTCFHIKFVGIPEGCDGQDTGS